MSFPGLTCSCADPDCHLNGCKLLRNQMANLPGTKDERIIEEIKKAFVSERVNVQGCICPPTSEMTCMNNDCPRRPSWKSTFEWVSGKDSDTTYTISDLTKTKGE